MNTPAKALLKFLEDNNIAQFGTNLFYGHVPSSIKTNISLYWVTQSGANVSRHNVTGEDAKNYTYNIHYRSASAQDVEEKMFALDKLITSKRCYDLDGFETIALKVFSSPESPTLDFENRATSFMVVTAEIYDITK